jgi:hypothetical protein
MVYEDIEMVESFKNLTKNIVSFFENNLFKDSNITCSELSIIKVINENESENKKVNITEIAHILKMSKSAEVRWIFQYPARPREERQSRKQGRRQERGQAPSFRFRYVCIRVKEARLCAPRGCPTASF